MAAESTGTDPPNRSTVTCSACTHQITDPGVVVHCPACGWQERHGAD